MSSKYYVVCIMGIISFLVFPLILTTYYILPAFAAESSPSADIKVKCDANPACKKLMQDIASKAAKLKQEVNRKLKDKAYIGKIKQKSDNSITLATQSNPKMVSINQDTVFENKIKSKQKFSQKTISEEDYVAALGDADETGVLTAKKIILLPASPAGGPTTNYQPKTYLWGQVISISDQLITLKNSDSKNVAVSIASASGIKLNAFVILTGFQSKNDIFKAGFVYVIPQGGVIKPKKMATPSATTRPSGQQIASPSAKPKPTSR